jgi:hypothetical protein
VLVIGTLLVGCDAAKSGKSDGRETTNGQAASWSNPHALGRIEARKEA